MIPVFEEAGHKLANWWLNQLSVSSEKQRVVLDAQNDLARTVSNSVGCFIAHIEKQQNVTYHKSLSWKTDLGEILEKQGQQNCSDREKQKVHKINMT